MKKMLMAFVFSLALFAGCVKDNSTYTPNCTGDAKSYSTDVAPLIHTYCSSCHSNFSTYSQLYASKGNVRSAIVNSSMPRGGSLSNEQKDAIVCWIDNGALNN
jgi:hypothetical protein